MDQSQTASDYKEYFKNKFITMFNNLLDRIIELLPDNSENKINLLKIKNVGEKLNFDKIIKKMEENNKLIDILKFLSKNDDIDDKKYYDYFQNKEKYWSILPTFDINKIALQIMDRNVHIELFYKINDLHVCAITYGKVLTQISQCETDGNEFNPFQSIKNSSSNIDIETLFSGVEVKNISAYDMIMSTLINQETNEKMDEYMNNMKESDINEAAAKLNNSLESENFQGNKQTSQLLSQMLSNIKDEVINLKNNNTNNMQGKQGVEQLLGIAQKVAGNMIGKIKDSDVSVLEIWDATSSLAKNTVKSDALNIVDNLIRSNIMQSMVNNNSNNNNDDNINNNINNNNNDNQQNQSKKKNKKSNKK